MAKQNFQQQYSSEGNRTAIDSFYQRMTRLFRSGPAIQRKVKGYDYNSYYNNKIVQQNFGYRSAQGFGRESNSYSSYGFSNQNGYGILDRMARYADFSMMETIPEIHSALDIFADESVGGDDRGKSFHVYSTNPQIKKALDELFYDVLNVEFNIRPWVRNLVKYGDFFLFNEVIPDIGVVNVFPIPVNEMERQEGFDESDPYAVRYTWLNRGNMTLENWQVSHFRLIGNDMFLPYGTSVLDSARRIAHQLMLMEDAMLVYRIVRSPERRVYYIDVGNTAPNDIPAYMEAVKTSLRSNTIVDKTNGRMDQRMNPLTIIDDIFIPTRGGQTNTKVDTLQAGANNTAVEDVTYLQKKLFSALKIPKAYLNYDESTGAKATLAQEDVRFSRTISMIQKIIVAELNKLAMVHLYAKGFYGEDLIDYQLKLSNPSTIAIQQRLELWTSKFETAGTAKESGLVDQLWIQKNILELNDDEIRVVDKGLRIDKIREVELESIAVAEDATELAQRTVGSFGGNPNVPGGDIQKGPLANPTMEDDMAAGGNLAITPTGAAVKTRPETTDDILKRIDIYGNAVDQGEIDYLSGEKEELDANGKKKLPIKASPFLNREKENRDRRVGPRGARALAEPDFNAMLSPTKNRFAKDVYDRTFMKSITEDYNREATINSLLDAIKPIITTENIVTKELQSIFKRFDNKFSRNQMLIETKEAVKEFEDDDSFDLDLITENAQQSRDEEEESIDLDELTSDLDK